jgi:hypothetical protein
MAGRAPRRSVFHTIAYPKARSHRWPVLPAFAGLGLFGVMSFPAARSGFCQIAGRQHAQAIALTARAPFEAMMAVSTVALVVALAAALWQSLSASFGFRFDL